eukprot:g34533.t1
MRKGLGARLKYCRLSLKAKASPDVQETPVRAAASASCEPARESELETPAGLTQPGFANQGRCDNQAAPRALFSPEYISSSFSASVVVE